MNLTSWITTLTENPMGHVATDFEGAGQHANTLRIRPSYRISLRLGSVEDLFPTDPHTDEGRMARLQVLGLFYFPLRHAEARAAFRVCWPWVKCKVFGLGTDPDRNDPSTDSEADDLIALALCERLISGAHAPFRKKGDAGPIRHGLPPDGRFAKLRVPGGYTFFSLKGWGRNWLSTWGYPFHYGEWLHVVEQFYYDDNPILGKIPLVAKVEWGDGRNWKAAPGATVYFQLLPPDPLPDPGDADPVWAQFNALRCGDPDAAARVARETLGPRRPTAHGGNCPPGRGGKAGLGTTLDGTDVWGVLFSKEEVPGFHKPHAAGRSIARARFYGRAEQVKPSSPKGWHSVRTRTNEDGEAGVVFLPSRMGGDRYKIRAFVGPPTLPGNGAEVDSVRIDTGTMVVWRNIRVSRILRKDAPRTVWPPLLRKADYVSIDPSTNQASSWGGVGEADYLHLAGVVTQNGDWVGLPPFDLDNVARRFAQAFCELEPDAGAGGPASIGDAEYRAAWDAAMKDAEFGAAANNLHLDFSKLFFSPHDPGSKVTSPESVACLPMRSPLDYADQVPRGPKSLWLLPNGQVSPRTVEKMNEVVFAYALGGLLRKLCKGGYLPGLTLVQGPASCSWAIMNQAMRNSGMAYPYRGAYVWYGEDLYPAPSPAGSTYGYDANHAHELGHCLYRPHAPGHNTGQEEPGGVMEKWHDDASSVECLMSYKYNPQTDGSFCAHCLFALRGWNIDGMAP